MQLQVFFAELLHQVRLVLDQDNLALIDDADPVGVINKGEIVLVEDKANLMQKLGKKRLKLHLQGKIETIPPVLAPYNLELSDGGCELTYNYDTKGERTGITSLLSDLRSAGIRFSDLDTTQSSLEEIFVSLVRA